MILKGFREFINESQSEATYADLKLLLELGLVQDIANDVYNGFDQGTITHDELLDFVTPICRNLEIFDWTLNSKGYVDVNSRVHISDRRLTHFPIRFGEITGDFYCRDNDLTTLKWAPQKVGGDFMCSKNDLTTLDSSPLEVGGTFSCFDNKLTTLEGASKIVHGNFRCSFNLLTSLKGAPQEVGKTFDCAWNELTTLDGSPRRVGGDFICRGNKGLLNLEGIGEVQGEILSNIK